MRGGGGGAVGWEMICNRKWYEMLATVLEASIVDIGCFANFAKYIYV